MNIVSVITRTVTHILHLFNICPNLEIYVLELARRINVYCAATPAAVAAFHPLPTIALVMEARW